MPASFNGFHIHVANDKSCTIYMNLFGNLKGAHPCTSSSEQGGGKRVLEDFV